MKCCCKDPLTLAEKEHLIKEAEKMRPLSESEKEMLIKNAELDRARGVCHYHHVDHSDLIKKFVLLVGILGALGLLYYLFMYKAQPYVPQTSVMEQREQAPQVVSHDDVKTMQVEKTAEKTVEAEPSAIKNADKIIVEEVKKEPAK